MYICAMTWFNYNGKVYKETDAVIEPANRGLRYGDGLFETMKMVNGSIIFANEHFARLWKGMQTLQFEIPRHFTPEKLTAAITALAEKNKHQQAARLRLTIIRGSGGLYDAVNHQPNFIIETWPLPQSSHIFNSNGLVLGIYTDAKKSCDAFSNIKHNNYLPYVMAALYAKKQQWNDAVILNSQNSICETTIANIFLVKDDIIFTPALTQGCVAGIVREQVIAWLKNNNYIVNQTLITTDMLLQADEIFITNAIYNIRWVQRINNKVYTNDTVQKIYTLFCETI